MKIEPRRKGQQGGVLMMPLKVNVPKPKDGTWRETICPKCGAVCWDRSIPEEIEEKMFEGKMCTMCALKSGLR